MNGRTMDATTAATATSPHVDCATPNGVVAEAEKMAETTATSGACFWMSDTMTIAPARATIDDQSGRPGSRLTNNLGGALGWERGECAFVFALTLVVLRGFPFAVGGFAGGALGAGAGAGACPADDCGADDAGGSAETGEEVIDDSGDGLVGGFDEATGSDADDDFTG